jgi:predicted RNA methylase
MAAPDPTAAAAPSLRARLAAAHPPVSMATATTRLIQALRALRRAGAPRSPFEGRAALDRALADPPAPGLDAEGLNALKALLARLVHENDDTLALPIAEALGGAATQARAAPVAVHLRRAPPAATAALIEALLGVRLDPPMTEPTPTAAGPSRASAPSLTLIPAFGAPLDGDRPPGATLSPAAAAEALHRLQGQRLGGEALQLQAALLPGERLPAVPREARHDRGRWARGGPWLRAEDEVGRRSLTPEAIARRQAAWAAAALGPGGRLIDAFCGLGGSAVAFAEAGLRVRACERDPVRAAGAAANLAARGLSGQAKLIEGDAERVVLDLCQRAGDRALLFVDPPWEPDEDGRATDFAALFAAFPAVAALVARLPMVMLKLPRAFDLRSLPPGAWRVAYELGAPETGDAQVVRMLTVARGLPEAPPAARAPRWID